MITKKLSKRKLMRMKQINNLKKILIELFEKGFQDMLIITDLNGTIQLYNNMLSQLCNSANQDEILLKSINIETLFKPEKGKFIDVWNSLKENHIYSGKFLFKLIFNQQIPFEVIGYDIESDLSDKFKYLFAFKLLEISDIELDPLEQRNIDLKKNKVASTSNDAIASLEELERMKDDFLSSVSHELRTPLASIIGFAETIKNDPSLSKEIQNEFIDIILNEGRRLAATINDLLDVSQYYRGEIKLNLTSFELNDLLNKSFNQYHRLANSINFSLNILPYPVFISADENKLLQAINNLVSNAIKFTPKGGSVSLSLLDKNNEYLIEVKDTGMGIPEKDRDKIFDRFYRVYRPGMELRGVGLGLSLTKKILDMHNFRLEFESKENKGSIFRIVIPKS